jgi:hypothetical protein
MSETTSMEIQKVAAIALIVIGALGLAYGGFSYTKETHRADMGPIHMSVSEKVRVNVPVWVGAGAISDRRVLLFHGDAVGGRHRGAPGGASLLPNARSICLWSVRGHGATALTQAQSTDRDSGDSAGSRGCGGRTRKLSQRSVKAGGSDRPRS